MVKFLDGKLVSKEIRKEIKGNVSEICNNGIAPPCLAVVLCTEDPASEIYVRKKQQACEEVGFTSLLLRPFEKGLDKYENPQEHLLSIIKDLNSDSKIHGILVQLPLPLNIDQYEVFDNINPIKDVDVFNPVNVGLLMQGRPRFVPCTPYGIQELLFRNNIEMAGKKVTIINRSDIVGKPLAALLVQDYDKANATVVVCHDHTPPKTLKQLCLFSDIIVVAVGKPNFLKVDMVSEKSIVVDVGINRVGNKVVGDCHQEVAKKVSYLSPVPGGIGPMTVTMLLKNTIDSFKLQI